MKHVSPGASPRPSNIPALPFTATRGNPFRPARGEERERACVCVSWAAWRLMQNSAVFCLFLVIVILWTGYVKQCVWQQQRCDAMRFLVRVYCVEVSMATVCVYRQAVWISNTHTKYCRRVCDFFKEWNAI